MTLIFCRHGETTANVLDEFQGVSDTPLTDKGIDQAKSLNKYLKSYLDITEFIISPLSRVVSTYKIASRGIKASCTYEPQIKEISYGELETKKRSDIDKNILFLRDKDRFHFISPGSYGGIIGSSYAKLYENIVPFLEGLIKKSADKTVVIIAHQGVMLCIRKYFLNLTDEEVSILKVPNNEIFIVINDAGMFNTSLVKL